MRLYIKGDYSKQFPYGYLELAGKMWVPEEVQKTYSNAGNNDSLQDDLTVSLMWGKSLFDARWNAVPLKDTELSRLFSHTDEWLFLDFEDAYISDYREKGHHLRLISTHKDLLTVDKRALYIMAIEVATAIDGVISEDDKISWITVNEFKGRHQEILSLTFEEAHEVSLEEISSIDATAEPLWKELDRQREDYIAIHGERVWEDEDDDEEVFGF
ncbi:TPA: hypothetical protein ACGOVD_001870 [Streptococcus suis]